MGDVMRSEPRKLTEMDKERLLTVKHLGEELHEWITNAVPEGRERSLALTRVEEAVMWAVKGLTG